MWPFKPKYKKFGLYEVCYARNPKEFAEMVCVYFGSYRSYTGGKKLKMLAIASTKEFREMELSLGTDRDSPLYSIKAIQITDLPMYLNYSFKTGWFDKMLRDNEYPQFRNKKWEGLLTFESM